MATTKNGHKASFQNHCRTRVRSGFINQPDGGWVPADEAKRRNGSRMAFDMQAGYRVSGAEAPKKAETK